MSLSGAGESSASTATLRTIFGNNLRNVRSSSNRSNPTMRSLMAKRAPTWPSAGWSAETHESMNDAWSVKMASIAPVGDAVRRLADFSAMCDQTSA